MVGWVTCDFTSFSTVFQSLSGRRTGDNERLCAMETLFVIKKISILGGARTRNRWISRPALNLLSYRGSCDRCKAVYFIRGKKRNRMGKQEVSLKRKCRRLQSCGFLGYSSLCSTEYLGEVKLKQCTNKNSRAMTRTIRQSMMRHEKR